MRLIFIDMHCVNFLCKTHSMIKAKSKIVTYKYKYIIDYAIDNSIEICNFITKNDSDIRGYKRYKNFLKTNIFYKHESDFCLKNSYGKDFQYNTIFNPEQINDSDIIIGFLYKGHQKTMKEMKGTKILMGNHFASINEPVNLDDYGINAFVNEIDLSDNEFKNKFIKGNKYKNIIAPYTFQDRFIDKHESRNNKAMAIGTMSTCKGNPGYKLYRQMYHTEIIQNLRKMIFDNKEQLKDFVDSYISDCEEDKTKIKDNEIKLVKLYKKFKNKFTPWRQNKYTSFNMVDKFNEYKMFLCPEEDVGMPGIGFVEGMACGTTYIGLETDYYKKLGLIPGEHYIAYDGSLNGLKEIIKKYQDKPSEVERIGKIGTDYVRNNFNNKTVATNFYNEVFAIHKELENKRGESK